MNKFEIELSDEDRAFLEAEAAEGHHASASAYFASMLRERRKQKTIARVQALLVEGAQGEMTELNRADLDDIRREVHAQLAREKGP
jgi:hypothetical protein